MADRFDIFQQEQSECSDDAFGSMSTTRGSGYEYDMGDDVGTVREPRVLPGARGGSYRPFRYNGPPTRSLGSTDPLRDVIPKQQRSDFLKAPPRYQTTPMAAEDVPLPGLPGRYQTTPMAAEYVPLPGQPGRHQTTPMAAEYVPLPGQPERHQTTPMAAEYVPLPGQPERSEFRRAPQPRQQGTFDPCDVEEGLGAQFKNLAQPEGEAGKAVQESSPDDNSPQLPFETKSEQEKEEEGGSGFF